MAAPSRPTGPVSVDRAIPAVPVALESTRTPPPPSPPPPPTPRVSRRGFVVIPAAIQEAVARQAVNEFSPERANPSQAEVAEIVGVVVVSVLKSQITPAANIDARVRSPLGRRLLELIGDEIMQRWADHGIGVTELPVLLLAIARVREAITSETQAFAPLGSDGLKLLVEMAHDMRSPLGSIFALAETLQRGTSGAVNDVQRQQLGLICTAALGLSSLGNDIIDLTHTELLFEPKPVPFSVTGVLESVHNIVRSMAEVKQLTIRVEPPRVPERLGNPVALRRILLNLTTNALRSTERGFVELSARETKQDRLEFAVWDSGPGIDPTMMPALFDPIRHQRRRKHEIGSKLFSKTGLGLTICRNLAWMMGSELKVKSLLGHGTRFFFELDAPACASRHVPGRDIGTLPLQIGSREA